MKTSVADKSGSVRRSLSAIVSHLTRLRRPAAGLLQPGLSREAIAKIESKLPFELAPELVALYSAMNGTRARTGDVLDDLHFFPGFYLLSLEDAATEYRRMRRSRQWKPSWFPVFANDAGDYYAVPCGREASQGVIGFIRGEPEQEVEYVSLDAMLRTIVECFAKGAFFVKGKGFEIDDEKHSRIAKRLNPGLAVWEEQELELARAEMDARGEKLALDAHRLLVKKKPSEALALYEEAMDLREHHQSFYVNALYALTAANAKRRLDPMRMRRMLDKVLSRRRLHPDTFLNAAFAWIALGDAEKCIECLRKAKSRGVDLREHLRDEALAPLAGDKRFLALGRARS